VSFSVPPISVSREEKKEKLSLVDSLEELWKKHLVPSKVDASVLFMDDVHYFLLAGQPDAYFTLRNSFQELARRGCNFSLVMTGPKLLFKDVADLAESFTILPSLLSGALCSRRNKRRHGMKNTNLSTK